MKAESWRRTRWTFRQFETTLRDKLLAKSNQVGVMPSTRSSLFARFIVQKQLPYSTSSLYKSMRMFGFEGGRWKVEGGGGLMAVPALAKER